MARQYFDDGSFIDTLDNGDTIGYNTSGIPVNKVEADGDYFRSPGYWADAREASKLDPYVPRPAGDTRPWYERVAEFGLTRAIDANFGPAPYAKGSAAGTYGGANGRTYTAGRIGADGQPIAGGGGLLPLLLVGAAAFLALG